MPFIGIDEIKTILQAELSDSNLRYVLHYGTDYRIASPALHGCKEVIMKRKGFGAFGTVWSVRDL
jgi:hypothetical protein